MGCLPHACGGLLQEGLGPQTSVFLSDVEADVWPPGTVANLSLQSAKCALRIRAENVSAHAAEGLRGPGRRAQRPLGRLTAAL